MNIIALDEDQVRQHNPLLNLYFSMQDDGTSTGVHIHDFVHTGETWQNYLERMATPGQWGTHLELNAAANLFCIPIMVVTDSSARDACHIWIYPKEARTTNVLILGFYAEFHYYSLEGKPSGTKKDNVKC